MKQARPRASITTNISPKSWHMRAILIAFVTICLFTGINGRSIRYRSGSNVRISNDGDPSDLAASFNNFGTVFTSGNGYEYEQIYHQAGASVKFYVKSVPGFPLPNQNVVIPDVANFGKEAINYVIAGDFTPNPPFAMTKAQKNSLLATITTGNQRFFPVTKNGDRHYFYFYKEATCSGNCQTCYNELENGCLTCSSWATLDWTDDSDGYKSGRCLCQTGSINSGKTGCDTNVCHASCKSCSSAGADKCYTCATGFTEGTRDADGTLDACTYAGACHSSCGSCSGSNANQCKTCANWSSNGATLTKTGTTCKCGINQIQDSTNRRCNSCPTECSACDGLRCTGCSNTSTHSFNAGTGTCQLKCHSSCATGQCTVANDASKCSSCADPTNFVLTPSGGPGTCQRICYPSRAPGACSVSRNPNRCTRCAFQYMVNAIKIGIFFTGLFLLNII